MQIEKSHGSEPGGGELHWLLLLVALSPVGLLLWASLVLAVYWPVSLVIRWSVSTAWALAVGS